MQFKDQMNFVFELETTPKRIICLVPSITELLVDLGLQSHIVGVTKFCVHPKNLIKEKTIVGGTKNIKIDKIKALQPDIIICNKEENTKAIVTNCKEITITYVSDIYTIADTLQLIHQFGKIFSCKKKAREIITSIIEKHNNFLALVNPQRIKNVAYFIWKKPWMVAANQTFINHLLKVNKFNNVFSEKERYPEIDLELLAKTNNLDAIFLSSEPYPFKEKDVLELQNKFKNTKIILVDGESFSWYGTRLLNAFAYFEQLHKSLIK
jgi:ABC-type Fe3+-hydroxamate transport system substrate-binding protein